MHTHNTHSDLMGRGVRGVVLEAFGVGNMPDSVTQGWLPWLRDQTKKGLKVNAPAGVVRRLLPPPLAPVLPCRYRHG